MRALTILTERVPENTVERVRKVLRPVKRIMLGKPLPTKSKYGGHYAVTRSAVEGLRKIGVHYNWNPARPEDVFDTVVVLAGTDALEQAIRWKRNGKIQRLLAGPNLVVLPSEARELITADEIDVYMVNSDWTYKVYTEDAPELKRNCAIWPAGVDTEFWSQSGPADRSRMLIYQKSAPQELLDKCRRTAESHGYSCDIITYGSYDADTYRRILRTSRLGIFLSRSESQGLALAEAWSMDVPTIVWDPGSVDYKGRTMKSSAAPYLSEETGMLFLTAGELVSALGLCQRRQFSPRQWVLGNMSDEVSARKLCTLAEVS